MMDFRKRSLPSLEFLFLLLSYHYKRSLSLSLSPSNSYSYDNRDLLGQVPPNQTYLEKQKKNVSPFFCIFKLEWQQSDKHCLNHYVYTQLPQNSLSLSHFFLIISLPFIHILYSEKLVRDLGGYRYMQQQKVKCG